MPNRRVAIQQLLFICAGTVLLPACLQNNEKASILLKKISISADQEKMLAELAETILPKTDSPGAKDLAAHLFALKMVDDCFPKTNQEKFEQGLRDFEKFAKDKSSKSFADCNAEQKNAIVADLDGRKNDNGNLSFFYQSLKRLTIQAYSTSQFYLTDIRGYKMIPGKFQGCVPLKAA